MMQTYGSEQAWWTHPWVFGLQVVRHNPESCGYIRTRSLRDKRLSHTQHKKSDTNTGLQVYKQLISDSIPLVYHYYWLCNVQSLNIINPLWKQAWVKSSLRFCNILSYFHHGVKKPQQQLLHQSTVTCRFCFYSTLCPVPSQTWRRHKK